MVLTGWTRETLGRQPAAVVRGLFHRIAVVRLVPELAEAERRLKAADALDLTRVPTADRAEIRHERESTRAMVAAYRLALGLGDDG